MSKIENLQKYSRGLFCCPSCRGDGDVMIGVMADPSQSYGYEEFFETCERCNGRGRVWTMLPGEIVSGLTKGQVLATDTGEIPF